MAAPRPSDVALELAPHTTPLAQALAGRYALEGELGSGATGTVHRARVLAPAHGLDPGTVVAIKTLRHDRRHDEAARRQLVGEGALGVSVRNPHVLRVFAVESATVGGEPLSWLLMEFVAGRTLRRFIADSAPVLGDLPRRIGQYAALGLEALHALGIVHRDVKPDNLLWTTDDTVKLMDLGLAVAVDRAAERRRSAFYGTPEYAAPEMLLGRTATPRSDLYALGVVLFEVVTGRHPFAGKSGDAMLHAQLEEPAPPPSHLQPTVTPFLDHVIGELLAKDPAHRFADAGELARALELGEASPYWQAHESRAPVLASQRRLQAMRRSAHTAFVDRAAERRRLDRALQNARRGRAVTVELGGPPGIGRRRLCDECVSGWLARDHELVFLGGAVDDAPTATRGSPFPRLLLDWFLRGDAADSPNAATRLSTRIVAECGWSDQEAARLARIVCGDGDDLVAPSARADLLARAVESVVRRSRGTILRIDHAEQLGTSARRTVARLRSLDAPLLLLLVTDRPLADPIPPDVRLRLAGLSRTDFTDYGRRLFRAGHAPEERLVAAWSALSGSPGALLESIDDLRERGSVMGRAGDYHDLRPGAELRPARPALQRLSGRIGGLPAAHRFVLQAAAVLGHEFRTVDVAALSGRPELEVLEALAAFDNRLTRTAGGVGTFRHRDYRLAVLRSIPEDARRRLHRAAAWLHEDRGGAPLAVGMHLSQAGEHDACLEPLLQGLTQLGAAGSGRTALRIAERIRLHLNRLPRDPVNLERRLRCLLLVGHTWSRLRDVERAQRAFRKANAIATHVHRDDHKAEALVGLADLAQVSGQFLTAMHLLDQAEMLAGTDDSTHARRTTARAHLVHGRVFAYSGQAREAAVHAKAGLERAPDSDLELRGHLHIDLARWLALRLEFLPSLRQLDRANVAIAALGASTVLIRLALHRGRILGLLGDVEAATSDLDAARVLAERFADRRLRGRALYFRGELLAYTGDSAAAAPVLREALADVIAAHDRITAQLARALLRIVDPDSPPDHVGDAELDVPVVVLTAALARIRALRTAGEHAAAGALCRDALALERSVDVHLFLRLALYRSAGRAPRADRLAQRIAARLPAGSTRRRFEQMAERVALA